MHHWFKAVHVFFSENTGELALRPLDELLLSISDTFCTLRRKLRDCTNAHSKRVLCVPVWLAESEDSV